MSLQLVDQLAGDRREIVDEIERIFDLVRDAGGELAERGELLRLDEAVLCGAQSSSDSLVRACALLSFRTGARSRLQLPPGRQNVVEKLDLLVSERAEPPNGGGQGQDADGSYLRVALGTPTIVR